MFWLFISFSWLSCDWRIQCITLWGLCRFAYHVLAASVTHVRAPSMCIHRKVRKHKRVIEIHHYQSHKRIVGVPLNGINGMGKHKRHKKEKRKREKQDKLERRERPGEWNLHIKWSLIVCRHSHMWKLEGYYRAITSLRSLVFYHFQLSKTCG